MSNISCRRALAWLLGAVVCLGGCGGGASSSAPTTGSSTTTRTTSEPAELFRYDASEPPAVRVLGKREVAGAVVSDIVYGGGHRDVSAYVVEPAERGQSRPGIVLMHWFSSAPNGNREEFVAEAIGLARQGAVSILPSGWFPWGIGPSGLGEDRANIGQQVVELRRAIDLLMARDDVDARRIGFVGHDYGAMYGALLSAFDRRPKAYALMAPDASFSTWFIRYWSPEGDPAAYKRGLARLDPVRAVGRAAPGSVFLQFGSYDGFVPATVRRELAKAARKPRTKVYDSSHDLNEVAQRERDAWLLERLSD